MPEDTTYYTKEQVGEHNAADDCWVSMHGKVLDLSALLTNNRGPLGKFLGGARKGLPLGWEREERRKRVTGGGGSSKI